MNTMHRSALRGLAITALLIFGGPAAQAELLSRQNVRAFRQGHPCPLTGLTHNACPGWAVALVTPRCAAGTDDPANMQWLTTAAADAKRDADARQCPPAPPVPGR